MTYIEEYLDAAHSGRVDVPKYVIKQYEMLLPIIKGQDTRWMYDPAKAHKPIEFAEKFCKQSKDEWLGKPVRYLLWQKAAFEAIYGIVERGSGYKKHQKVFIEVAKKNGKTTMFAPVALYETAKKGNEVYSAANGLQQSRIIWTEAANMLDQSPALRKALKKRQFAIKNIRPQGYSVFMPLANQPDVLDGKLPKVVFLDEVHELDQTLYDILYNGQIACADPLFIMASTNGYKRGGLFDTERENSVQILDGAIKDERKFSLLYELDDPKDWMNEAHWGQANPSLGYTLQIEKLREIVQTALAKPNDLNAVKVKHFNLGGVSERAYFEFDTINNERKFDIERLEGHDAIGAFDLSLTNDLTAFATLFWDEENKEFCVAVMFWISQDFYETAIKDPRMGNVWRMWVEQGYIRIAGINSIDHTAIVDYATEMVEKHNIFYRWIYYDPYSARYLVTAMHNQGFREDKCLIRCYQGSKTLSVPFQRVEAELKAKKINYNNNPVVKWCMTNVAIKEDPRNKNPLPEKAGKNNTRKIDGFAVILDAFVGVCDHEPEFIGEE